MWSHLLSSLTVAGVLALPAVASAQATPPANDAAVEMDLAHCTSLRGARIDSSRIGIPSGAALITDAVVDNEPAANGAPTRFCKVTGEIAALTAGASVIHFQVNLPGTWNRKLVMTGGGGFNGVVLGGLGPLRDAPHGTATPLAKGYATASNDSGHVIANRDDPEPASFTLNNEMMRNFAFEAYKKTTDVSRALLQDYFGQRVRYTFYFGGSEGGREGLTMAQRYPNDFDGIVSVVPVISLTGLLSSFAAIIPPQRAGGLIDGNGARFLAQSVMAKCDMLDGIRDGVVSNYLGCHKAFSVTSLRCPPGKAPAGGCLTGAQVATLEAAYEPTRFPFAVANGITFYPGRLSGGEVQVPGDNFARWISTGKAMSNPPSSNDPRGTVYGSNFIRYLLARDAKYNIASYDPAHFEARLKEVSALIDSTNPDLSAYFKHGGKLIMRENGADTAQSPLAGFNYYESVVRRMGRSTVERFFRLYVSPSSSHGGTAFSLTSGEAVPTEHDLLADIDAWATAGKPPADVLEQVATKATAPYDQLAARPMCRYPRYPHYVGGDRLKSSSYSCRLPF
jgi:feruloyl esterase